MRILRYRWAAILAVVGGVVAATPLAMWVVGDLSSAAEVEGPGYTPPPVPLSEGGILGLSYRTWVADVVGANIGAGLVVLIFLPVAGILLLAAAISAYLVRPRPERMPGSSPPEVT